MTELLEVLEKFVTPNKKEHIERVLKKRTRHLTVILEDIFQPHNASAVVRTCDCFGIQDLHIIENENRYNINPKVVMGASKWVDMYNYCIPEVNNTVSCLTNLKQKGYKIVATSPDADCLSIDELPLDEPIALVFGTELTGISDEVVKMTDEKITIPMYGFTESLNISVSAAIILHQLTNRLHKSDVNWQLTDEEKNEIRFDWYKKSVNRSEVIIESYQNKLNDV